MTVEAALVLPLFIFSMVLIGYMGVLMSEEEQVQMAMVRVAREASAGYGATEGSAYKSLAYYQGKLALYLRDSERVVSLLSSEIMKEENQIDLVGTYKVKLPFRMITVPQLRFRQRVHMRAFTGVETRKPAGRTGQTVYVAENGSVYHQKLSCTYLTLSISQVVYGDLEDMRNRGGGIYKECERCCKGKSFQKETPVWITNFGDKYHSHGACSGLKRKIREMDLSQVGSRTPCSKCCNVMKEEND